MSSPRIALQWLGYAGLIPFVVPAIMVMIGAEHAEIFAKAAEIYAFGIICFLTGSWWGMALSPLSPRPVILSNLFFLIAFGLFLFARETWGLAAAILLMSIFFAEQNAALFPVFPAHYRKMRRSLTLVASASMLCVHFAG